jgi:hypothetical protein
MGSLLQKKITQIARSNIRASEGSGTTTLTKDDIPHQVFNLSAGRTVKLPSTGVKAGDIWKIENLTFNLLTLQASDASELTRSTSRTGGSFEKGSCVVRAAIDTPTTASNWLVVDVEDLSNYVTGTSGGAVGVTFFVGFRRRNEIVTIEAASGTASASASNAINLSGVIPTRMRGSNQGYAPSTCLNAGSLYAGVVYINTNGTLQFLKYDSSNYSGTSGLTDATNSYQKITWVIQ